MKQIPILILLIVVLFTNYSCQSSNIRYIGQYNGKKNSLDIFILNADSTFEYGKFFMKKYSTGKWTTIGDGRIILNSDIQERIASMDVKVTPSNEKHTSLNVNLNVPGENSKDYICIPILNDSVSYSNATDYRGSYSVPYEEKINDIYFKIEKSSLILNWMEEMVPPECYKIYSEPQRLQTEIGDNINVNLTVSDSLFYYRIFTDAELKIKGNNLYFKDTEKGKTFKCKRKD